MVFALHSGKLFKIGELCDAKQKGRVLKGCLQYFHANCNILTYRSSVNTLAFADSLSSAG